MAGERNGSDQVLVWTPVGRDSELVCRTLEQVHVACAIGKDLDGICRAIREQEAAAAVIAEEALGGSAIPRLVEALRAQPPWSDFPFVILTTGGTSTENSLQRFYALEELGHITLLERPLRRVTLTTAVRAALQSRRRQYQLRDHLIERRQAEEELVRQAEELARSNADLQQFAYVASHDLQEPIRSIASFAQLFVRRYQAGSLSLADAEDFLGYVVGGAHRMQQLVQDLLQYSRVVNTANTAAASVSLDLVFRWACANLQRAIEESGADVDAEKLPVVQGDQVQLVQLMQNLLSNAIKYRKPDERPNIRVRSERQDGMWLISVTDNGVGFHQEYAEKIFGIFKRLHGRDVPGTGIGLATCKKIVERHGGRIWAKSEPGRGAVFCFTLPDRAG